MGFGMNLSVILVMVMAAGGYGAKMYIENQANTIEGQRREIAAKDLAMKEQVATIEALQQNLEKQTAALQTQMVRSQEIQAEVNRYLDIFRRHDLAKLAAARPGMIEPRVNNGTKEVFDAIEADSVALDQLDD